LKRDRKERERRVKVECERRARKEIEKRQIRGESEGERKRRGDEE
jgi:hypothetical protein